MTSLQRCWGVLPAAGVGRRMGGAVPKQYCSLAGRLVIEHALDRLLGHPSIERVCVALATGDLWWDDCCYAGHERVVRVEGGAERSTSVLNALGWIERYADPEDWVMVHDAARPCLRGADIDRLMEALADDAVGGILACRINDTIKLETSGGTIAETIPRERLWRALTPQMFRFGLLYASLNNAQRLGKSVTDEASAIELAGLRPRLVEGHADNIKITHLEDLDLAAFYLQRQSRSLQPPE
ncbi:MAG: 2-C-methyl-D-erythritol 4-phosphate cytidylyltransferase [Gammaproteobacteria bacterium]|nr:2-C-methyl-D-erythritol 4-phosphate cytidylyltransferase [Gammaproteobacteria bacterium]